MQIPPTNINEAAPKPKKKNIDRMHILIGIIMFLIGFATSYILNSNTLSHASGTETALNDTIVIHDTVKIADTPLLPETAKEEVKIEYRDRPETTRKIKGLEERITELEKLAEELAPK